MCQTKATLISIVNHVGVLEVFEPLEGLNLRSYLRFKVAINITKPLLKGLKIKIREKEKWILIKYESLLFYYFCCGMIDHNFRGCENYDRNECPDLVEIEYGPFLKTSPMKKGCGPMVENNNNMATEGVIEKKLVTNPTQRGPQSRGMHATSGSLSHTTPHSVTQDTLNPTTQPSLTSTHVPSQNLIPPGTLNDPTHNEPSSIQTLAKDHVIDYVANTLNITTPPTKNSSCSQHNSPTTRRSPQSKSSNTLELGLTQV
ncbi:hypothetical protein ACS0TY_032531 [Phlomoides rotata]